LKGLENELALMKCERYEHLHDNKALKLKHANLEAEKLISEKKCDHTEGPIK